MSVYTKNLDGTPNFKSVVRMSMCTISPHTLAPVGDTNSRFGGHGNLQDLESRKARVVAFRVKRGCY